MELGVFVFIVAVPVILLMLVLWGNQKRRLGRIKCRRCRHVGPAKGLWRLGRGMVAVCSNCDSEDWVKVRVKDDEDDEDDEE